MANIRLLFATVFSSCIFALCNSLPTAMPCQEMISRVLTRFDLSFEDISNTTYDTVAEKNERLCTALGDLIFGLVSCSLDENQFFDLEARQNLTEEAGVTDCWALTKYPTSIPSVSESSTANANEELNSCQLKTKQCYLIFYSYLFSITDQSQACDVISFLANCLLTKAECSYDVSYKPAILADGESRLVDSSFNITYQCQFPEDAENVSTRGPETIVREITTESTEFNETTTSASVTSMVEDTTTAAAESNDTTTAQDTTTATAVPNDTTTSTAQDTTAAAVPNNTTAQDTTTAALPNDTTTAQDTTTAALPNDTTTSIAQDTTTAAVPNDTTAQDTTAAAVPNDTTTSIAQDTTAAAVPNDTTAQDTTAAAVPNDTTAQDTTAATLPNDTTTSTAQDTTTADVPNDTTASTAQDTTTAVVPNDTTTSMAQDNTTATAMPSDTTTSTAQDTSTAAMSNNTTLSPPETTTTIATTPASCIFCSNETTTPLPGNSNCDSRYSCANGQCINVTQICDGNLDCDDFSDEGEGCQNRDTQIAVQVETIFRQYGCVDVLPSCVSEFVTPLIIVGGPLSEDKLCTAFQQVYECAVYRTCLALSDQDRDLISSLLQESFQISIPTRNCQLVPEGNTTTSAPEMNTTTTTPEMNVTTATPTTYPASTSTTAASSSTSSSTAAIPTSTSTAAESVSTTSSDTIPTTESATSPSTTSTTPSTTTSSPTTTTTSTTTTTTKPTTQPPSPCITSCRGLPSGDYQSCNSCRFYITCVHGMMYDNRPCPGFLVWDDTDKRCEMFSTTCSENFVNGPGRGPFGPISPNRNPRRRGPRSRRT